MLWGRVTYEMMEHYWPAVARGDVHAPPAIREWALKLEAKPKYVVSSTRKNFPWTNSHHITDDLLTGIQKLKEATPQGVLVGSGRLATELDRLGLIGRVKTLGWCNRPGWRGFGYSFHPSIPLRSDPVRRPAARIHHASIHLLPDRRWL